MGAAASALPESMDKGTCRSLFGDAFNESVFDNLVRESGRGDGSISKSTLESFLTKTDVFLTHDWGKENGKDNHARVSIINTELKKKGLTTWFDEEQMQGNIKKQMTRGIDNAQCIVVFVTNRYMMKVDGDNPNDNCQLEFNYATNRKSANKMVAVVMEEAMRQTNQWVGELGMVLGPRLYVDCCGDLQSDGSYLTKVVNEIFDAVIKVIGTPIRGWPEQQQKQQSISAPAPVAAPSSSSSSSSYSTPAPAPAPKSTASNRNDSDNDDDANEDEDENTAVVLDFGSLNLRIGFAGDDNPRECASYQELSLPTEVFQKSQIQNFDGFERLLHSSFYNYLRVAPEEHAVLLTEPVLNPKANREKIVQILFETFNVPACYIQNKPTSSLYSSGRTTGLVVLIGEEDSCCTPIYEGYALPHAIVTMDISGKTVTECLKRCLRESGESIPSVPELHEIKKTRCIIASSSDEAQQYDDDAVVYQPGEVLFDPSRSRLHLDAESITSAVYDSIMKCDVDIRKDLYANIVLSGGATQMKGFSERLRSELTGMAPSSMKVKVISPGENSCWVGGSILSSLSTFQEMWIKKEEYDEAGPGIVHRKCF